MIKGIGIDIIELDRIFVKINDEKFLDRILTQNEKNHYIKIKSSNRKTEYLAGRFAAKEAYSKACGTGIGSLSFLDIEILNDINGKPYISKPKNTRTHITISHNKVYAIANVIIEE